MKKMFAFSLVFCTLASTSLYAAPNAKKIANGKFLFEDWGCKSCHAIGTKYNQDPTQGPDLKGLFSRRSMDWLKKFTADPKAMIDSGDKDATEMFKKYNVVMKKYKISPEEWDDIFEFLKSEK